MSWSGGRLTSHHHQVSRFDHADPAQPSAAAPRRADRRSDASAIAAPAHDAWSADDVLTISAPVPMFSAAPSSAMIRARTRRRCACGPGPGSKTNGSRRPELHTSLRPFPRSGESPGRSSTIAAEGFVARRRDGRQVLERTVLFYAQWLARMNGRTSRRSHASSPRCHEVTAHHRPKKVDDRPASAGLAKASMCSRDTFSASCRFCRCSFVVPSREAVWHLRYRRRIQRCASWLW